MNSLRPASENLRQPRCRRLPLTPSSPTTMVLQTIAGCVAGQGGRGMKIVRRCVAIGSALAAVAALAACGSSSSGSGGSGGSGASGGSGPVTIGTSLSLSGDFAADGQAFQRGYQLWVADQNAKGGLLGHKLKLDVLSDSSSPAQVV